MHSFSWNHDDLVHEPAYNTHARRIFPWPGVPEPSWGGAWVAVDPGETVTPHSHDEKEAFFVVAGEGRWRMGEQERKVGFGDTLYMTPFVEHSLTSTGAERLVFLSIWWDGAEAVAKERARWAERLGVAAEGEEPSGPPAAAPSEGDR
jgi:mannose-6-phosphate isomerase-like protein (cupin superfamily)